MFSKNKISKNNIPNEAYLYFPTDDEKIKIIDKKPQRIFFDGQIVFTDHEMKMIQDFKQFLLKQNHQISSWWNDAHLLRFLYAYQFKHKKVIKNMKTYMEWRETNLPAQLNPNLENFLKNGGIYVHGRDNRFRPIVVFSAYKINVKEEKACENLLYAFTFFLTYVVETLMIPGQIENWNFILDFNNMSVTDVPISVLKSVLKSLQNNFISRLYRMYLVNTPKTITFMWGIIKGFLEETTTYKISILSSNIPEGLFKHTNKFQIEEKYGGSAKNVEIAWPPIFPSTNYFLNEDNPEKILISKEEYLAYYKKGYLKANEIFNEYIENKIEIHNKKDNKKVNDSKKFTLEDDDIFIECHCQKLIHFSFITDHTKTRLDKLNLKDRKIKI